MHILLLYFLATPALAPIRGSGAEDVSPATFHPHDVATRQTSERPTDGGLWSFDPSDVVTHFDEPSGGFRIHYSIDGPNQTLLADADDSGVPDMVELVGATAAVALELFTEQLGFRPPPTEADLNLGPLGGSDAYDIYLVDFGGGADGAFGTDACLSSPRHCTGYLVIENDFVGYSYPSLNAAVDTLVSHELFHAVTAAYDAAVPVWISEGTAVWAEHQFDPDSEDFVRLCNAYLADTGRTLYRPPGGPVQGFAYGVGLWWDFVTTRNGVEPVRALFEAVEFQDEPDYPGAMAAVLELAGDPLAQSWPVFARYNLATGSRAGGLGEGHADAPALRLVETTAAGSALDFDLRVFPLASEYMYVQHNGGPLWFGLDTPTSDLEFSLHPTTGDTSESPVGPAIETFVGDREAGGLADGTSLAAGGYWLVASFPAIAEVSAKTRLCVGSKEHVDTCLPDGLPAEETTTGEVDEPTEANTSGTAGTSTGMGDAGDAEAAGCGCTTTSSSRTPSLLLLLGLWGLRRGRHGGGSR